MCEYLSELCLVDVTTNKHSLSLLSAAVLHVALTALGRADTYPRTLARHARYKLEEVLPAARYDTIDSRMENCFHCNLHCAAVLTAALNMSSQTEHISLPLCC